MSGEPEKQEPGCLVLLGFLFLQLIVGGAFYGAGYGAARAVLRAATFWSTGKIDGWSFGIGLLFALVGVGLVDRWCKKATGTSLIEEFGNLPPWP